MCAHCKHPVLRHEFSKLFNAWPFALFEGIPPDLSKLIPDDNPDDYNPATPELMEQGAEAIASAVKCSVTSSAPFTARSGGHNNAGASVMTGLLTIDVRGLNTIQVGGLISIYFTPNRGHDFLSSVFR